ncbi:peptidoglycan DD-metalloendopeptidase family protein [Salinicoccus roseus]|uniref:peptidoglycan DD-metalloendopeptidase family protein n=1 Tax=Salinicoccus roseus TaxID=45670 RepID=UPI003DA125C8
MSESRISGLSIGLDMDSAGIERSMNQIKNSFREVKRSAQTNLNNLKFDTKSVDNYKKNLNQLNDAYKMQKDNVNGLKRELDKLEAAGKGNSQEAQNLRNEYNKQVDEMNKLGRAVEQTTADLKELEEQQRISNSRWNKMGESLDKNGQKWQSFGGGMKKVGGIFTAASAAIVGGAVGAGAGLLALTNKATEAADSIAKGAEKIGTSTDFYQEMDFWASQNGLSQENMEKAVGRLNQRMGLAIEGNDKYASALERLGVDLQGVEDGTVSTEDAMAQSITTLSQMENEHEKAALASELFGTKMSRELMPALNDGSLTMEDARKKAQELGLVMSEEQMIAAEKFQDAQDQIKRSMGAVAMQIGLDLMPHFQKMFDWIRDNMPTVREKVMTTFEGIIEKVKGVIKWWGGLSDNMKRIIPIVTGTALAFGPVLLALGSVASAIGGFMSVLGPLFVSLGKLSGTIKTLGGILPALKVAFAAINWPITLTVAAIAALGAGFVLAYNKSETFRNFISGLRGQFTNAWQGAMQFKDKVIEAISGVTAMFKGDWMGGATILKKLGMSDEQVFQVELAVLKVQRFFHDMKEGINNALSSVKKFFINQFEGIRSWWDADGQMILAAISTVFEKTFDTIRSVAKFGLDFVRNLFETFAPIVSGIWSALWPTVVAIAKNAWSTIQLVIGTAMDVIKGIISLVSAAIEGDWSRFGQVLRETASSIKNRIVQHFTNLKNNALELFGKLFSGAKKWFIDMLADLTARAVLIYNRVTGEFRKLKNRVLYHIKALYNSVKDWFINIYNTTRDKMRDAKNKVVSFATDMKDGAIEKFKGLSNGARDMMDKVGDWIDEKKQAVIDKATSLGTGVANAAISGFNKLIGGINSVGEMLGISNLLDEIPLIGSGGSGSSGGNRGTGNRPIAAYSTGTNYHKGGAAIVGDKGPGNGGGTSEIVSLPNGRNWLYNKESLIPDLPKGSKVFSNRQTEGILGAGGAGSGTDKDSRNWVSRAFDKGKEAVSGAVSHVAGTFGKVSDFISDAWDYMKNPGELASKLVSNLDLGFNLPSTALDLAKGGVKKLTSGIGDFFGKWFDSAGGEVDGSSILGRRITAKFGKYPAAIARQLGVSDHYGLDTAHKYEKLTSPVTGRVTRVWHDKFGGNAIQIKAGELNWWFMHMQNIARKVGDMVKAGKTTLGTTGNTGLRTTGYHLHTQAMEGGIGNRYAVNPLPLLKKANSHLYGGQTLTDGLFNLHGGEYIINPDKPTEAMKLLALAGKDLAGKSKQTNQLPTPGGNNDLLAALIEQNDLTRQQNDLLMKALNKNISVNLNGREMAEAVWEEEYRDSSLRQVMSGRPSYGM